jgi:hypothetical protein
MDRDNVQKALGPYAARLRESIVYGHSKWVEFGKVAGDLRAPLDARTRACFINRHIVARIQAVFADDNSVRVVSVRGFIQLVLLKSRLILRFKKLDESGRSRNILTRNQRLWFSPAAKLPETPAEAMRLVAGYVLDVVSAELTRVLVTLPNGPSAVMWIIELPESGGATVIPMPRRTPKQPAPPRVRSRKSKEQSDKDQ